MRPSLVIPRIRAQAPIFQGRVAGAKGIAQAIANDDLPAPNCFIVLMGITPAEEALLGPHKPQMLVQLAALICVPNAVNDERGQGAAEDLYSCFLQLRDALQDWTPDAAKYGPVQMDALTLDGETYNRARAWAQVDFNSTADLPDLV
jgi:hypothetical protein